MTDFKALVLHEKDGKLEPRIERLEDKLLPPGEVLRASSTRRSTTRTG